ncbi:hypothetical protein GCM10027280_51550 [Micromonospora polyrhachis]|uniref:Uncharacterized protein n=1 Tax=Micromonospora polyrhachis TaxID=1282883 RepID=A0A7W7SW22_9ACTN|nr:hypothetical protein [Micromonospora polyrhachis]MBB4961989.1 hypothetical protein [Micromonospora polyrhachis]
MPTSDERRNDNYLKQSGRKQLTPRQRRRAEKKKAARVGGRPAR